MENFSSLALKVENNNIFLLDQQLLPHQEKWIDCTEIDQMIDAITNLKTRGAPLIGIAAAFSLQRYRESNISSQELKEIADRLWNSRPTAVNLTFACPCLPGLDTWMSATLLATPSTTT